MPAPSSPPQSELLRILDRALGSKVRFRRLLVLIAVVVAAVAVLVGVLALCGVPGAVWPAVGVAGLARVVSRWRGPR